jgi:hypothetical protein
METKLILGTVKKIPPCTLAGFDLKPLHKAAMRIYVDDTHMFIADDSNDVYIRVGIQSIT